MSETEKKNYSETLNLPKTDFPMRGNLPEREPAILEKLEKEDIYNKLLNRNRATGKKFVFHDGPPYANGNIHLGHAFNKTLKDIIIKYKNMSGYYAPYIPGWDTHGLPIEKKVEQVLKISKDDVGISEFRKKCKEYALEQVEIQERGFKRLGVVGDFENRYVTLDPDFEVEQIKVFSDMYKKGYIYRDLKPVYWCEDCRTALAEAEIEYQDDTATSIFVKFKVNKDNGVFDGIVDTTKLFFVIWTTTPWTMPGNQAVTVNPEFNYSIASVNDEFYVIATEMIDSVMKEAGIENYTVLEKTFKGKEFENILLNHPILKKTSRVILGSDNDLLVTLDAGTGLVHTAPGHGHEDYLACKRYGDIEIICPVDEKGYMTEEAGELEGLKYTDANKKVIEILGQTGALLAKKELTHPYPHCWRCHKPVIYRATTQWFASVKKFRDEALNAVKKVKWYPKWGEDRMINMLKDRGDWCISRQRVWGVPIPIFYCECCGKEFINDETINRLNKIFKEKGTNAWYDMTPEELLGDLKFECECGSNKLVKETDIMDVWFDSGSSHFAVLDTEKYGLSWPADLYLEGNDQYRGWFQSSLLTSVAVKGVAPYKATVTHGFLIDEDKRKMSKSLGNGVDPLDVCNKFGADILRLWTVSSDYHADVKVSNDIIIGVAEVYKKIRNTSRFMLGNLYDFNPNAEYVDYENRDELDKYIMYKLNNLVKESIAAYDEYEFHTIFNGVHRFCTAELSSRYLDVVKDRLYTLKANDPLRKSIQSTMYDVIKTMTILIAPILSFTAEEIWGFMTLKKEDKEESVLLAKMPEYNEKYANEVIASKWDSIYELRDEVLVALERARADKTVGHPLDAKVIIFEEDQKAEELKQLKGILEMVFIVSKVEIKSGLRQIIVEKADGRKCERCWKYNGFIGQDKEHETICPRCIEAITD